MTPTKKKRPYIHMSCIVISHFKNIFGNCDFNTKQKSEKKKKKKEEEGYEEIPIFLFRGNFVKSNCILSVTI